MATIETARQPATEVRRPAGRRVRVAIRRINPWSVLKFSLLLYFCLMLVFLLGFAILFTVLNAAGVLDSVSSLLVDVSAVDPGFRFEVFGILRTLFLFGLISVVVWSVVTVFVAFLYNLISDLVGGIEVTLVERRS